MNDDRSAVTKLLDAIEMDNIATASSLISSCSADLLNGEPLPLLRAN
jgi:hypothetical protein